MNSAEWLRRGRLLISRSCLREHYHALNQAAIPLIPLFRFPEPLLYDGALVIVRDNAVRHNTEEGIYLYEAAYAGRFRVEGNDIRGNRDDGIEIYDVKYGARVGILGNLILENGDDGIDLDYDIEYGGGVLIDSNVIAANAEEGIDIDELDGYDFPVKVTVSNNTIGAWTDVSDGRRYSGNGEEGIYVSDVDYEAILDILGNTISENGDDGIELYYVTGSGDMWPTVTIAGNTIGRYTDAQANNYGGNAGHGVNVMDADDRLEVVVIGPDNDITGNRDAGVFLDYDANYIRVVGNDIRDNAHGVWVIGDDNRIGHNNIENNNGTSALLGGDSGVHITYEADRTIVRANNIVGNGAIGSYGVFYDPDDYQDVEPMDARGNWWGDPTGPRHDANPGGLGDSATFHVDFADFLAAPAPVPDVTPPTIVTAGTTPDTISWARILPVEGPGSGFNPNSLNFESGEDETVFVVEPLDEGYSNGISGAWLDLASLYRDILAGANLDLTPERQRALDEFLTGQAMVPLSEDREAPIWTTGHIGVILTGTHQSGTDFYYLYDYDYPFCDAGVQVGDTVLNVTTGASGVVSSVLCYRLHFAAGLSGGTRSYWASGDVYQVLGGSPPIRPLYDLWYELLWNVYQFTDYDELQRIAQHMDRGTFDVPVWVEDWSGNTSTAAITITVVDMQIPLFEGWNARSTPIGLEGREWQADWLSDPNVVAAIIKYDPVTGWYTPIDRGMANNTLDPLDGVYIHTDSKQQIGFIWGGTSAPVRKLGQGWNLTGLAAHDYFMSVNNALSSVDEAPGGVNGWTTAASLREDFDYDELWLYGELVVGSSYWSWYQDAWIATAPSSSNTLYIGDAYWVSMDNDYDLTGFSLPPVRFNVDWID